MGTAVVMQKAPASTEAELKVWFENKVREMARDYGTATYQGNWTGCQGLCIVNQPAGSRVLTLEQAERLLDERACKGGPVFAVKVGDFSVRFPASVDDRELGQRLEATARESGLFDLRILERAQAAKSRTRKCAHCESSINVHKMRRPQPVEVLSARSAVGLDLPGIAMLRGQAHLVDIRALTTCPVCGGELLKTETDKKAQAALNKRLQELQAKYGTAKEAYDKKVPEDTRPFWLLRGDCPW